MNLDTTKKIIAWGFPLLACLSTPSWAVVKGALAYGPAYSAVIGIEGRSPGSGCSAVVIHPRALLTAAHCLEFLGNGYNHFSYPSRNSDHRLYISKIYEDPYYNARVSLRGQFNANDDIALVILKKPIEDQDILSHIPKITEESSLSPDETLMAVGLGMYKQGRSLILGDDDNSERRTAPYRLQQKRSSVDFLKAVTPGMGMCGGDSGGALLRVSSDGAQSQLVGILTATGGSGVCGDADQTDYAESVSSHLNWIKENLQKEGITLE
ncbi:MAG: trypsin-like serine protease [Bdellovibrionia bacterium]